MSLQDKGRNNMMLSNSRTQTAADAITLKAVSLRHSAGRSIDVRTTYVDR